MEMLDNLNALMQFYRQNVQGPRQSYNTWDGAARMANDGSEAALWARDMMGRVGGGGSRSARPDFFAEEPGMGAPRNALAAYREPESFDMPPMRQRQADPLRPQIRNYIARMLGGSR